MPVKNKLPGILHSGLFIKGLTPVTELARMGDLGHKFRFQQASAYLASCGKDIDCFYFNRGSYLAWFCYYREGVVIDIPFFTEKGLRDFAIVERINLEEACLKRCLENGDFKSYFYLVDPRVALYVFESLLDIIPESEKYSLMGLIYSRGEYRLQDFPREFVKTMLCSRQKPLHIPGTNHDGYVEIYLGRLPHDAPVSEATSWTLDINTAIYQATRQNPRGEVYRGRIHSERVVGYIKRRNEKEIIAYPEDIEDIQPVQLRSMQDLLPEIYEQGIDKTFSDYAGLIHGRYFHRPEGIHGTGHTMRVLFLVLLLSVREKLNPSEQHLLALAAVYHDIGRIDDNFDPWHGLESYRKLTEGSLLPSLPPSDHETIRYIIENHCLVDRKAFNKIKEYQVDNPERVLTMFKIFKDADGLDRIRINDLDVKHLRTSSAQDLLLVARQLLDDSSILSGL